MMTLLLFGLLALDPNIANIQTPSQVEEANQLFENGQFTEAKQRYEQALKADPDNGAIAYNLANAHAALGDTEQAQAYYRKAIQSKDPDAAANAKFNLGNLMMKQKQMDKAVEQYIEYLTEHPNDIDAKRNLELALKQLEQQQQQQDDQQQSSDENQEGDEQQDQQQSQSSEGDQENQDEQQSQQSQGDQENQDEQQSQQSQGDQENQDEQQSQQSQGEKEEQEEQQEQQSQGDQQGQEEQQSQAPDRQEQDEQSADEQQEPQNQQDPNQMSQARIQQIMEALKDQELEAQREMQQRKLGPPKRRSKDW